MRVLFQKPFFLLIVRHDFFHQSPKALRVIVVHQMREFVYQNIIHHILRGKQQTQGNIDVSLCRATSPIARVVLNFYAVYFFAEIAVIQFVNPLGDNRQKEFRQTLGHQIAVRADLRLCRKPFGKRNHNLLIENTSRTLGALMKENIDGKIIAAYANYFSIHILSLR